MTMLPQTVLITGAKEGMGFLIAKILARKKYRLLLADKQDLTETKTVLCKDSGNVNIETKYLDLTSLTSVRTFAKNLLEKEKNLHILINNAGVFCNGNEKTEDLLHPCMQINHFSPFLLTCLLSDLLKKSAPSRIIFVTSSGAFLSNLTLYNINDPKILLVEQISSALTYYNSKLCNMIISKGLSKRLASSKVTSNCFHPGMLRTDFVLKHKHQVILDGPILQAARSFIRLITIDPIEGAMLASYLATSEKLDGVTGKYFVNFQIHEPPIILENDKFCDNIWSLSEHYTNMSKEEKISQAEETEFLDLKKITNRHYVANNI